MTTKECQDFLDKIKNNDFDIRLMAISDLSSRLRDLKGRLSKEDGEHYTSALVEALVDANSQVQNDAMGCLSHVLASVDPDTVTATVTDVCNSISTKGRASGESALSAALRVMVTRLPEDTYAKDTVAGLARPIVSTLADAAATLPSDVKVDLIDALAEILVRVGEHMSSGAGLVESVQDILLANASNESPAVRRRAIAALGKFIISVPEEFSNKPLNKIFERYTTSSKESETNTFLRVLVVITRQCPSRVTKLIPVILERELATINDSERELRITSLLALETILQRSPELAGDKIEDIYGVAISALKFDPNYNYDDEDDGGDGDVDIDSEDELDDEFDDDIYADDEDDSWDIRLSAAKLLSALVGSGLFSTTEIIARIGSPLVSSFKEREDVVRAEVLVAFANMLETIKGLVSAKSDSDMEVEDGSVDLLAQQTPKIVASLLSAIRSYPKSTETKQLAFVVFKRLVAISEPILDRSSLSAITQLIVDTLNAKDTSGTLQSASTRLVKANLKLDALDFLHALASRKALSSELYEFAATVKDGISGNISSTAFQVPSAALDVAGELLTLLRSAGNGIDVDVSPFVPWAQETAAGVLPLVNTNDQPLRSSTYVFIGTMLRQLGDLVDHAVASCCFDALTKWKAGNVDSPVPLIRALVMAIAQPTHLPSDIVISAAPAALDNAHSLLSLSDAKQYIAALNLIENLADYGADAIGKKGDDIAKAVLEIINRSDISPPGQALAALTSLCPYVGKKTIDLSASCLMRSLAPPSVHDSSSISALAALFGVIARRFPDVVEQWMGQLLRVWDSGYSAYCSSKSSRNSESSQVLFPETAIDNNARCLMQLFRGYCESQDQQWSSDHLAKYIFAVPKTTSDVAHLCLSLRVLGHAAKQGILGKSQELVNQLYVHIESKNDDVRSEAALALGNYAAHFTDVLPELFAHAIPNNEECDPHQLPAVKTAVDVAVGANCDAKAAAFAWAQLTELVQKSSVPVPDIVAQCLAVLCVVFPGEYVPQLTESIATSSSAAAMVTFITAFRTVIAGKQLSADCDKQIGLALPGVLSNISHGDVSIRRLSLLTLYTIIQTKDKLLDGLVSDIQPALFQQTVVNDSLVREITMGPFKKKIDDGLEARRCAYQCVYMLVRTMPRAVDAAQVADSIVRGITDEREIRAIVQLVVAELASTRPDVLAGHLDAIAESLQKQQKTKVPKNPNKMEVDLHNEMLRSTVAIMISLEPVSKNVSAGKFEALRASVADAKSEPLHLIYEELLASAASG
ncbi:TIP120-domain-containing protein [Martensiomyces pterosporus]|nr:TIP120-domain-containing protein [Martensiomyces pterosporus]